MPVDIGMFVAGVKAARDALGLLNDAKNLLPTGDEKIPIIEAGLDNAERSIALAEADVAKGLGFRVCECDWPPTIMVKIEIEGEREWHCRKCERTDDDARKIRAHNMKMRGGFPTGMP